MGIVSRSQGGSGSGGAVVLFSSALGADTASIDSGAGGFSAAFTPTATSILFIDIVARTDDAAAVGSVLVTLNNDGGANYDNEVLNGTNVTASAGPSLAQVAWTLPAHGAGSTAGYPSAIMIRLPLYAATTFNKVATGSVSVPDGVAANISARANALGYRSTLAISRVKVAVGGAGTVLKAGSTLVVSAL